MRSYPEDKYDEKESERLIIDPWILDLLKMNPSYPFWGPYEDYMCKEGDGWDSRVIVKSWKEFREKGWELDELNEVANYYFSAERDSVKCPVCGGCGEHPDAQWITESFYRHSSPFCQTTENEIMTRKLLERFGSDFETSVVGKGFPSPMILAKYPQSFRKFCEEMRDGDGFWHNKITQEELDALLKQGRFMHEKDVTLEKVNNANSPGQKGFFLNHDAINRGILCEARCKQFGVPYLCPECKGHGDKFTEDKAHASLTLWVLHPRKGCSRGVRIERIEQEDLPAIFEYLRTAAQRNAERFSKIPAAEVILDGKLE